MKKLTAGLMVLLGSISFATAAATPTACTCADCVSCEACECVICCGNCECA